VLRTYSATGRPPQGIRRPRWSAVIGGDPPRRADCGAHRSACLSGIHWDADCPTAAQSGDELEPARPRWHSSRRGCRLRRRVGSRRALRGPDGAILLGQVSQPLIVQGIWCRPTVSGRFRSNGGCLHGTVRQRRDIWDGRCETHDDVMQSERNRLIPTRIYSAAATR